MDYATIIKKVREAIVLKVDINDFLLKDILLLLLYFKLVCKRLLIYLSFIWSAFLFLKLIFKNNKYKQKLTYQLSVKINNKTKILKTVAKKKNNQRVSIADQCACDE